MARQLTDVDLGVLKEALKGEIHHAAEKRYLHRLHCVLLVSAGQECSSVANWFGESSRSVERWVDSYYEFGPLGLKDDDKSGRLASLDADQFQFLLREIAVTPECLGLFGVPLEWQACYNSIFRHTIRWISACGSVSGSCGS